MKLHHLNNFDDHTIKELISRPTINFGKAFDVVRPILDEIKESYKWWTNDINKNSQNSSHFAYL